VSSPTQRMAFAEVVRRRLRTSGTSGLNRTNRRMNQSGSRREGSLARRGPRCCRRIFAYSIKGRGSPPYGDVALAVCLGFDHGEQLQIGYVTDVHRAKRDAGNTRHFTASRANGAVTPLLTGPMNKRLSSQQLSEWVPHHLNSSFFIGSIVQQPCHLDRSVPGFPTSRS
jgi:hypothetical protein